MGKRHLLLRLAIALMLGLGVLGLGLFLAGSKLLPVFVFPVPGGPHPIGTLTYHLIDSNRAEILSPSE